jgi:signal transduction histidine kinase
MPIRHPHAVGTDRRQVVRIGSRDEMARIVAEHAALRRVATLVARGVSQNDLFAAVNEEIARPVGADATVLMRFEPDNAITLVAGWSATGVSFPLGERRPLDAVFLAPSPFGRDARRRGIRTSVGVPIQVDGRTWGVSFAGSSGPGPFPDDIEGRIARFTELVATAVSNVQARDELQRLADEQAALRRLATLVARESPPSEVFAAVAEEVGRLLGAGMATMYRYEDDGTATVAADWGERDALIPIGTRMSLEGESVAARVRRSGRPARIDDYAEASGAIGAHARSLRVRSGVGTAIVVEGRLWGAMVAVTRQPEAMPADAEARIGRFTELVATAISNIEARSQLAASRARIVTTADAERRQVVRDLHDGAQQRLIHTVVTLKLARQALKKNGNDGPALVTEALDQAEQATTELRELVHGILPSALTHGGLRAGVEALAARMPMRVENGVWPGRFPAAVEATAYFVVAEALTNVAKHSGARRAWVTARVDDGRLRVRVRDDGAGGARPDGSGLLGLADRLAVLDGRLDVKSPTDSGTVVTADIPLAG